MLERRRLAGGVVALVWADVQDDGFLVAFTERAGGSSSGPYASLNLGLRVDDDYSVVLRNRRRACESLGVASFAMGQQIHGARHARVGAGDAGAGFDDPGAAIRGVDALITESLDVPIAILTADCVPVSLVDRSARQLAVIHAGWRGIAAGVVANTVAQFDRPGRLRAMIGPAICIDHYQVGEDVARAVIEGAAGPVPSFLKDGRMFLDVRGAVAAALRSSGVRDVEQADGCTAGEPDRFFSYRRDGVTGRQALIGAIVR